MRRRTASSPRRTPESPAGHRDDGRTLILLYRITMSLVCVIFTASVALNVLDPDTSRRTLTELGFPEYWLYPQTILKALGLVAILSRRSPLLADLAFAGFCYDVVLAAPAHFVNDQPGQGLFASATCVLTLAAFWAYRRRRDGRRG